ncbi:hypothetical protein Micbo1qcDRAFT_179154 [Microdochium bolleyi]|uniref:Uncharacterized protein n=1 Tax=Microdochium bolleyi TaxID=196109 RepID=A0A136IRE6_9PEZI|nr:hypothetical protein Micbo1qcDRAFT_179154 [Microdochium bolleyi]
MQQGHSLQLVGEHDDDHGPVIIRSLLHALVDSLPDLITLGLFGDFVVFNFRDVLGYFVGNFLDSLREFVSHSSGDLFLCYFLRNLFSRDIIRNLFICDVIGDVFLCHFLGNLFLYDGIRDVFLCDLFGDNFLHLFVRELFNHPNSYRCLLGSCHIIALQTQGDVAVADCSSRLVTTVTPFPVIITEVTTVTSIVSTLDSTFFTETTTTTGTTETSLFTSVEIVTATATSTAVAQTTTVATSTSTSFVRGPTTTTWNFGPTAVLARGIEARQTLTALPDYAAEACESEEQYESACSVIGVQSTTITAPTPTITAINTIIEPLTTTWTTVSSTQTDVAVVTATESTTTITTSTATITTLATSTNTQTSTSIVRTTTTSTTTIENLCRPTGTRFRLPVVIPGAGPGQRNYLSVSSNGQIIAQNLPANPSAEQRRRSSFEITRDRSLQGMWGILIPWVSSYSTSPAPGATVLLQLNTQGTTDLNVALGRARNVFTCIDRTTNVVRLFDGLGRQNLAVCGQSNQLAISSGDGSDRATCKPVTVTAEIL